MKLGRTVSELLCSISSEELSEWMEFYQISPFGYERTDFSSAQITAMIANVNRDKNTKAYNPTDFMFSHLAKQTGNEQTWEEQFAIAQSICAIQNMKGEK